MKTLTVNLTDEQFARVDVVARLNSANPEDGLVALALSNLDSCNAGGGGWGTWESHISDAIDLYVERKQASDSPRGKRLEDSAPDRRLRIAGYAKG